MMIPAPVFSQNMMMPMGQNTTVPVEQTTHYKRYHGDGIDDVLRLGANGICLWIEDVGRGG